MINCKKRVKSIECNDEFSAGMGYGDELEKTEFLIKYLEEDKLEIETEIEIYINKTNSNKIKLINKLGQLFKSGSNYNALIKVEDDIKFKVHKCILAQQCPKLGMMLQKKL